MGYKENAESLHYKRHHFLISVGLLDAFCVDKERICHINLNYNIHSLLTLTVININH